MRPIVYGLVVVLVLFIAAMVISGFQWHRAAQPEVAVGLAALAAAAMFRPIFWVLYIAGFGLTYWLASG